MLPFIPFTVYLYDNCTYNCTGKCNERPEENCTHDDVIVVIVTPPPFVLGTFEMRDGWGRSCIGHCHEVMDIVKDSPPNIGETVKNLIGTSEAMNHWSSTN